MLLINIGTDRNVFIENSLVQKRIISYGNFFEAMKVIVFTGRSNSLKRTYINRNIEAVPTQSISRWAYVIDAIRIVKKEMHTYGVTKEMVISCQDPFETGLVGYVISKRYGAPLRVEIHTDIGSPFFRKQSILNRIRLFIAKFVLKRAKMIRVVSPSIKKYVVDTYNISDERIVVLPILDNFIPDERRESNEKYILMVSRLEKEKQIDKAIIIFKNIVKHRPNLVLKIAGEGREGPHLKHLVKELGISQHVEFLGNVKNTAQLYAHAYCLFHTSSYEGFGLVLYEAMKAGCPIVTTSVGIAPDLKSKNYEITLVDINTGEQDAEKALIAYTDLFTRAQPVDLDFMPKSPEKYLHTYIQSVTAAVRM